MVPDSPHALGDASTMAGTRCLVVGGGGFIGQAVCAALMRSGAGVTAFGRSVPEARNEDVTWVRGDADDAAALAAALERQDVVIHLAGTIDPERSNLDPLRDLAANAGTTISLVKLAGKAGVRHIIFASSGGTVYGPTFWERIPESAPTNPISAYGVSKLAAEKYIAALGRLHEMKHRVLRIANPYGPGQSATRRQGLVGVAIGRALQSNAFEIWGDGSVVRDFVYIDDVARAFVRAIAYEGPQTVFNVGSGVGISVRHAVEYIYGACGADRSLIRFRPGRPADVPRNVLANDLIARETGWHPTVSWPEGIERTIAWMRGQ
jgi:UDP-glucose 4-epimerase